MREDSLGDGARTHKVPVRLADGSTAVVEATIIDPIEQVLGEAKQLDDALKSIEGIARSVVESLRPLEPSKFSVQFGVEVALHSGKLTALWVQGSAKANALITVVWTRPGGREDRK